jgi:alpha(1,3/1,4) fucosyltransferase
MYVSIHASYFSGGLNNEMFDSFNPINRDGLFDAFILLKAKLLEHGIELNTPDVKNSDIEIYLEGRPINQNRLPKYLIAMESPLINGLNGDVSYLSKFNHVFTWQEGEMMFPSNIKFEEFENNRDIFSCMIVGNKSKGGDLYSERLKVIEWYGESKLFHLYGKGWNCPSWRGEVPYKRDILSRSIFCWCYENHSMDNWITEKIFDCFTAGCIPIYWGAPNVTQYIPKECFINRRDFKNTEEVHEYLLNITPDKIEEYQSNIKYFLENMAYQFSNECFANTIVKHIVDSVQSPYFHPDSYEQTR